jgi:ankyrin repeat protein
MDEIRSALQKGDARAVRGLLERHAELRAMVNEPLFPFDSPALVCFASGNNVALIDVLLEFGADPNRRSDWWAGGFHALHTASDTVAERLLAAGAEPDACAAAHLDKPELLAAILAADPSRVHERGGDGQTPLHFARSRAVVDMLLAAGADPDARDVDHRSSPAEWMLDGRRGAGRYELASYLVECGASTDIFLATALGLAARVRSMIEAEPGLLDLRTSRGNYGEAPPASFHIYTWTIGHNLSPLEVAARFDHAETVEAIRSLSTPRDRLLAACTLGDAAEANALLDRQPDLIDALTPEHHSRLANAAWFSNARSVALMLDLGFDPAAPGQDGGTALHCAAWQGAVDCVAVLLQHPRGRELIDHRDPRHHSTALGWCCHGSTNCRNRDGDYPAVARMLLEAGAVPGPNLRDATAQVRNVIESLKRKG